jgi:glycosyltransferase involved in cell wall biosynthesis
MCFTGATIVVPTLNESDSLRRVFDQVRLHLGQGVEAIIVVVCEKTHPETLAICRFYEALFAGALRIHWQRQPGLGMALREAFATTQSSHVMVVYSDGEADPGTIPVLLERARDQPNSIISASRWIEPGLFENGGMAKRTLNLLAQRITAFAYKSDLTDFTFGYRIYPTWLVRRISWEEHNHAFVYESVLKPIRLGVKIVEVPTRWRLRDQGISSWPLLG